MSADERTALRRQAAGDDVVPIMLERYAPLWLAGILGAGIMAAVMASDSQILALSTMFTEDVFAFYGGKTRFGEHVQVQTGPAVRGPADARRLRRRDARPAGHLRSGGAVRVFRLFGAVACCFFAALFWKRSTKWGALAVALWVAGAVIYTATTPGALAWFGLMPVVPMTLIAAALMVVVSLLTPPPGRETLARFSMS